MALKKLFIVAVLALFILGFAFPGIVVPSEQPSTATAADGYGSTVQGRIIAAALGGFAAWILTKIFEFLLMRHRLRVYLTVVINNHLMDFLNTESG